MIGAADSRADFRAASGVSSSRKASAMSQGEREAALKHAVRGLHMASDVGGMGKGTLLGWDGGAAATLPFIVAEAIAGAFRMPATVEAAWGEFTDWQAWSGDRVASAPDAIAPVWVHARLALLEEVLDTRPARTVADVLARLSWLETRLSNFDAAQAATAECLVQLRQDIEAAAVRPPERAGEPSEVTPADPAIEGGTVTVPPSSATETVAAPSHHRTREEARAAVRALLGGDLNDREIARRVGVSPSTVAAVRRASA